LRLISPTWGSLTLDEVAGNIQALLQEDPESKYKVVIGTDSHTTRDTTLFVTALIIHRIGKGARFFFHKTKSKKPITNLRHRIYRETELSLEFVELVKKQGIVTLLVDFPLEIHIDIGQKGETKQLIQEVTGWVTSVGYVAKIKPASFGASAVADRFTS
jgi:predicted RNase H-related nuclease YkuK (DUF458 family)